MREKYLDLLGEKFPTREAIVTEIINLEAILNLPKATEHFISDLHGEYEAFDHILRNGSGNVKQKINDIFKDSLSPEEISRLTRLIYYPEECILYYKEITDESQLNKWYAGVLDCLVETTIYCSSKYTRSKVRKSFPPRFSYIMEELLYNIDASIDKSDYYDEIVSKIILLDEADDLITAFCYVIQRLVVDHLHVVGDVYDRGPYPDKIMDRLMDYHSVDIQWGNHDILWMGAVCGSEVCAANLLRICARYDNLDIIEDAYGINLRPLQTFAEKHYSDNLAFRPKLMPGKEEPTEEEILQATKIHQAISIIQFKLEKAVIQRRPELNMEDRLLLEKVDYENNTIEIDGTIYPLENTCFELVDPSDPTALTEEEKHIMEKLMLSFRNSEKLIRHIDFLFSKGTLYLVYNNNLIIHGCVPLNSECEMVSMTLEGKEYKGKDLLDRLEKYVFESYRNPNVTDDFATDIIWYLWTGEKSPLFGKKAMTTFERYFIADKKTHHEELNPYYKLRDTSETVDYILKEFNIDPAKGHIVNGHTPVKEIKGESPIKAGGKMIVIDGGYSRVYQKTTGIGGYTLLYNSYGMEIASHQPFTSRADVIHNGADTVSTRRVVDEEKRRQKIRETNIGARLSRTSKDLHELLEYRYSPKK